MSLLFNYTIHFNTMFYDNSIIITSLLKSIFFFFGFKCIIRVSKLIQLKIISRIVASKNNYTSGFRS